MKKNSIHIIIGYLTMLFAISSCIDPFDAETQDFEGILVVDARLTDEVKQHQVLLSRARPFEQDTITPVRNAQVSIIENSGTTYVFQETAPGHYVSSSVFAGKTGNDYQLKITTSEGTEFSSVTETMPEKVSITNLEAKRKTNDFGEDGVALVVDNESLGDRPRYLRYDYEENYEIRAPNWEPFKLKIIDSIACTDGDAFEVIAIAKNSEEGRICYGKRNSTRIILASTANLQDNIIDDVEVQFVNRENFILTHRYSIQVNQYSQSVGAHSYYQNLEAFNVSESVFSEVQPGFLSGNIASETDSEQKVIGYFETAAISSRRIFFNYEDVFPEEPLPEYPIACFFVGNPRLIPRGYHCTQGMGGECDGNCTSPLITQLQLNLIVFAAEKDPVDFISPFLTLPRACGDCTVFGSEVKPDFWID